MMGMYLIIIQCHVSAAPSLGAAAAGTRSSLKSVSLEKGQIPPYNLAGGAGKPAISGTLAFAASSLDFP